MLKLELLKSNTVKIMQTLLKNQNLCKYLKYNQTDPLSQPDLSLPAVDLLFKNMFPFPFDENAKTEYEVNIFVYHTRGNFKSNTVENNRFAFDIAVPKNKDYWLLAGEELRPEAIMFEVVNALEGKDIGIGGTLKFLEYGLRNFNEKYNGLTVIAEYVNFSTRKK